MPSCGWNGILQDSSTERGQLREKTDKSGCLESVVQLLVNSDKQIYCIFQISGKESHVRMLNDALVSRILLKLLFCG